MEEGMVCNIKREGVLKRYKVAFLMLFAGVVLTYCLNEFGVKDWSRRLILLPIFQAAFATGAQAPARTCVLNAALGVDENETFTLKRIASMERVFALRLRAAGMMFVSCVLGLLAGLAAIMSARLSFECTQHTCSLFLS